MIPDVSGRPPTDAAPGGQGRAEGTAAAPRTLDGPHLSVGHTEASRHQRVDFAYLKREVPLAAVLERYGVLASLKRSGVQLAGPCPLHNGSGREFVADLKKNVWHCFAPACNRGGSVIDFVAQRECVEPKQAARIIAQMFCLVPETPPSNPQRKTVMSGNKPSHKVFVVEDRDAAESEQQKGFWTRVGSAWPHRDGKGLQIQIVPGIAVSGRIVLREWTDDDESDARKTARIP